MSRFTCEHCNTAIVENADNLDSVTAGRDRQISEANAGTRGVTV